MQRFVLLKLVAMLFSNLWYNSRFEFVTGTILLPAIYNYLDKGNLLNLYHSLGVLALLLIREWLIYRSCPKLLAVMKSSDGTTQLVFSASGDFTFDKKVTIRHKKTPYSLQSTVIGTGRVINICNMGSLVISDHFLVVSIDDVQDFDLKTALDNEVCDIMLGTYITL